MTKRLNELKKLKVLFHEGSPKLRQDYWTSELLALYSESLGERIRWKWQDLLSRLRKLGLHPEENFSDSPLEIIDWGCGPGTAALAFAQSLENPLKHIYEFEDRSATAVSFAKQRLREELESRRASSQFNSQSKESAKAPAKILLVSYVLSELRDADLAKVRRRLLQADAFLWLDAASHKESRRLSRFRNSLLEEFHFHFPCPHQQDCPLSEKANPKDWCHLFAKAPGEIFHDGRWGQLSKILRIDLRSLPYSALYGCKKSLRLQPRSEREFEILGRPRPGKHSLRFDACRADGSYQRQAIERKRDPEAYAKLKSRTS